MSWRLLEVVVWSKLRIHPLPLVRPKPAMSALDPLAMVNGIKLKTLLRVD